MDQTIFEALKKNVNFFKHESVGVPASHLDEKEFPLIQPLMKESSYIQTLIANPNHIGCHTIEGHDSEPQFAGTQKIEEDFISICAEEIFDAQTGEYDGYIASGGTEANIQAIWIYRNFFMDQFKAKNEEIAVVFSEDSHYSMPKAANLLLIDAISLKVDTNTRSIIFKDFKKQLNAAKKKGIKYIILVGNLGTTMFGSVDNIDPLAEFMEENDFDFKIHIDAAFGGFIYPFLHPENPLSFKNKHINSFTIDGHKMLQAPYGTGIFLVRKNYMHYVLTKDATYVQGHDCTLVGSRSGANAIALWKIIHGHGKKGWQQKIDELYYRTNTLCDLLDAKNIHYYRNPYMNIVTIKGDEIPRKIAIKYGLVADDHDAPKWWKIVVMQHVDEETLKNFINEVPDRN